MLSNVLSTVNLILELYWYVILARILISWFPDVADMWVGRTIIRISEPYLAPFRRFIPPLSIGSMYLDVSALVAILVYAFVKMGLLAVLQMLLSLAGLS